MSRPFKRRVWCFEGHAVSRRASDRVPTYFAPLCPMPLPKSRAKKPKLEIPTCPLCIRLLRTPGASWRIQAVTRSGEPVKFANMGVFDELVIDDWFHLEQMDNRTWWFCVGTGDDARHYFVHVERDGRVRLNLSDPSKFTNWQDKFDALCAAIRKWHRNDDDDGTLFAQVMKLAGVDPREAAADEELRAARGR
jgi:hypothetical protein